ncbi:hypothetical protein DXA13_18150 [Clostridium sp. AM58-1XD]|nr:hypothetical protein DXA13_18150 [Clostridium sp. AM58-1XD]
MRKYIASPDIISLPDYEEIQVKEGVITDVIMGRYDDMLSNSIYQNSYIFTIFCQYKISCKNSRMHGIL